MLEAETLKDNSILNPYTDTKGDWVKGNLHTHSNNSHCGRVEIDKVLDLYQQHGYDFIALTDHDMVSEVRARHKNLIVIKGYEASQHSHILSIGNQKIIEGSSQKIINGINKNNGISILCHPNWKCRDYWSKEEMGELENYTGIEIYNAVINRLVGSSEAFEKWDYLLKIGKKVWGFANDDFHYLEDINKAWNVVRVKEFNEQSILNSIKTGNFYTSSGVQIFDICVKNGQFIIESDADKLRFISGGRILLEVLSSKAVFDLKDFNSYLRVEAIKEDGARAWTQPIFKIQKRC